MQTRILRMLLLLSFESQKDQHFIFENLVRET